MGFVVATLGEDHGHAYLSTPTLLKGLSRGQLLDIINKLVEDRPDIEDDVRQCLPRPGLSHMEEKLNYLKRNIFKALPNTRLESKTDSMAYNRVSIHLTTFKKAVVDSVKSLLEGQQWLAIIDYTVMAWAYVQATPVW